MTAASSREPERAAASRLEWPLIALAVAAAAGIVARLWISSISAGTNDIATWESFANSVRTRGLSATYAAEKDFNHPPLMGLMAGLVAGLCERTGLRFAYWFRLPGILAEAGTTLLVWAIVRRRATALRAATVAALFAWNPCTMLVSGYHGNTDCIYPLFALMSAWLAGDRGRPLLAGLALGASLNVKLMPAVLVPPLLLVQQTARERLRFCAGLAIALLPFAVALLATGEPFARNVLGYNPPFDSWGIAYFLGETARRRLFGDAAIHVAIAFSNAGRWIIVALVALASLPPWSRRFDRYQICALALAIALVLAPGFGIQDVVAITATLFVVDLRAALWWSWLSGTFVFLSYLSMLRMTEPYLYSVYSERLSPPGALFGLLAWAGLAAFAWRLAMRPAGDDAPGDVPRRA